MKKSTLVAVVMLATFASSCWANGSMRIDLTLAKQDKGKYHKPYVAVWLETKERKAVSTLAIWYRTKKGEKWLKDLRQWWRKAGSHSMNTIDAATGATRKAGHYQIKWDETVEGAEIPAGDYVLHLEAVREKAGREHLRIPISFPLKQNANKSMFANGKTEFGPVSISINTTH